MGFVFIYSIACRRVFIPHYHIFISYNRVLICHNLALIHQWHFGFRAVEGGGVVGAVAEVVEGVVVQLPVGDFHRGMIDAAVACVGRLVWAIDGLLIDVCIVALKDAVAGVETVGQVHHLAHLSVLEQGGVALAVDLRHLPAHGRQQQFVLAGHGVGLHLHALAIHGVLGLVLAAGVHDTVGAL